MTTRNFRVNNGLEVGDVTISASTNKITGLATSAPSGDGDVVTKAYSYSGTQTMTNKTLTAPVINSPTLNGPITVTQITVNDLVSNGSNADITLDAAGTGDINLTAGADVNVPANIGITFGDDGEKIEGDGTDLTIASSAKLNLTATTDVHIPQGVGLVFDTAGTEKIESDGTDLSFSIGANGDINVPSDIGLTFGDDGEKIEGNGTKLTISSSDAIDLTATTDVVIPANVGLTFGTGEKIEGDNTDLTVTSGAKINLTATSDVHIPQNVGIVFDANGSEKIESNDTDLTISGGAKINLSATSDVHIPQNVGIVFDANASEKIESNDTDLTVNSGADINLTATADVNIPANVGITFGDDGEKIEGNGTNLTIASSGLCTITATGETVVTNNLRIGGNLTVDGTETIINTTTLSVEDNIIELNRNVSAASGMPSISGIRANRGEGSTATELALYWAWDESFADDGTTTHGNVGGAWTAFAAPRGDESGFSADSLIDIRANVVHATATSAQYADVAERFEADAPMAVGAVVEVGGDAEITETTSEMSENVFGVISDQPAYAMNAGAGNNDSHPFVAMTGRTPVRVTGAVTKGQRLVSSTVKGCARAAATGESISPFNVIGRALESSTDAGIKLVNCAVRTNN